MSYYIVRFFKDHPDGRTTREIIRTGLTLEEAQAHCSDPETSSSTATNDIARRRTEKLGPWFDGYDEEESADGRAYTTVDGRRMEPEIDDLDDQPPSLDDDEWTNREGMPEFNGSFR